MQPCIWVAKCQTCALKVYFKSRDWCGMPPKRSSISKKEPINSRKRKQIDGEENKSIADAFKRVKKPNRKGRSCKTKSNEPDTLDASSSQEILKCFDLNCDYGPIIGITRTDRLIRAEYFNLTVSEDVKKVLKDDRLLIKYPELNLNIWHDLERLL